MPLHSRLLTLLFILTMHLFLFFFFQAEDGIRDRNVTGVQTCALPICDRGEIGPWPAFPADLTSIALAVATQATGAILIRSEERRVGKEGRLWGPVALLNIRIRPMLVVRLTLLRVECLRI